MGHRKQYILTIITAILCIAREEKLLTQKDVNHLTYTINKTIDENADNEVMKQ